MTEYGKRLHVTETPIPGLVVFDLPVHGDARGWFKENWQREKMTGLGLLLAHLGHRLGIRLRARSILDLGEDLQVDVFALRRAAGRR